MRKSSSVVRLSIATGLCAMSLSLVGCVSGTSPRHAEFLSNPTPDLETFAQTQAEIDNRTATTLDTNYRRFNHELNRAFFFDRPMRGGYPIPY